MQRILLQTLAIVILVIPAVLSKWMDVNEIPILENPSERFNLLVVTRHGTYYPLTSTVKEDKNPSFVGNPPLQLTEKGRNLMQVVGKMLMKRYGAHFRRLVGEQEWTSDPNIITITSTDQEIARQSAEEIIKGIKDQNSELRDRIQISLSKEYIEKNDFFDPSRLKDQEKNKCKTYENKVKSLKNPKSLKANLFKNEHVEEVFQQYDRLQMEAVEGLDLPDWTQTREGQTTLNNMKKVAVTRMQNILGGDMSYWRFFVSTLFNNIFTEFKIPEGVISLSERSSRKPRFHLHVVDDHLMTALVWWLRLDKSISIAFGPGEDADYYPQVGDALVFEITDDLYLKAFYLRPVEENGWRAGFQKLYLGYKVQQDFGNLASRSADWSVQCHWFYLGLLKSEPEWKACCNKDFC